MNTPAHLIFGAAAFGRPDSTKITLAALFGALAPDLSLYVLASVSMFILQIPARTVFNELYFSDAWQLVFSIDNSFILWGIALGLAVWTKTRWTIAMTGAALLHIAFDFPLHHDDGRAHFWPLSNWIYESPVSYWDNNHFGHIVAPIEIAVCLGLCVYLWRKFSALWARIGICVLALAEAAPAILFGLMFSGGAT